MADDGPSRVSASDDPAVLLEALAANADRALGAAAATALHTERDRSLGDRLAGRPGTLRVLRLDGVDERMELRLDRGRLTAEAARVSGGVVISRRTLPLGAWLTAFAGEVAAVATEAAGDAATAARALHSLGIGPADALVVAETDVPTGLLPLRAAIAGRVPDDVAATVDRIAALLRETLPRVAGSTEGEFVVARTATDYLPGTLRAYLALPRDWAARHRLADGRTPAEALLQQVTALEVAVTAIRDAAVEQDARAVLVNGRFLEDRFRPAAFD